MSVAESIETTIPVLEDKQETKRKVAPKAAVCKIEDFNFERDVKVAALGTGTFKNAKLTRSCDGGVVMVSLNAGGEVNKEFGVETSSFGGLNINFTLTDNEYNKLKQVHDDMLKTVVSRRDEFFPGSTKSDEFIEEMANATVHPPKPKKEGGGHWPASMSIKVEKEEDLLADSRGKRKCKVKSKVGGYVDNIFDIKGCSWEKAVIEMRFVYVQSKGSFGISKKLRLLTVGVADDELDVATDSEDEEEDEAPKKKQRVVKIEKN